TAFSGSSMEGGPYGRWMRRRCRRFTQATRLRTVGTPCPPWPTLRHPSPLMGKSLLARRTVWLRMDYSQLRQRWSRRSVRHRRFAFRAAQQAPCTGLASLLKEVRNEVFWTAPRQHKGTLALQTGLPPAAVGPEILTGLTDSCAAVNGETEPQACGLSRESRHSSWCPKGRGHNCLG